MAKSKRKTAQKAKERTGLYHARKARGLSLQRLADLADTTKQTVGRLETGKMELTKDWAERFAPHLAFTAQRILFWEDTPTPNIQGFYSPNVKYESSDEPAQGAGLTRTTVDIIPIVGIAEAGAWRQMPLFEEQQDDIPHIAAARSRFYPRAKHFALEVRGDSMNAAKPAPILDGMIALCVDLDTADIEVETGKLYAVRQTRDGGKTFECTIKRAKVFKGHRVELHHESTNPNHKSLVIAGVDNDGATVKVEAFGLVYFAGYDFER